VKKRISPLFLLIFSLTIIQIACVQSNPGLEIIVKTDKQQYYARYTVQVYGNLTLDGMLVTDGLVGIQIQTSQDRLLTIRTMSTGNPPPETPYVFIEYVVPCDQNGTPRFTFPRKTLAYFKISVANMDIESREALMTINTYYGDGTPFGFASIQTKISAQSNPTFIISIPIPKDAPLGTAFVYANAYTDWPKLAGTPYCREVNATFEILSGTLSQTVQHSSILEGTETGNFNLTFKLPSRSPAGNYTVYATSRYLGQEVFNFTKFPVYMLGDLGSGPPPTFFAYDGNIDAFDYTLWKACYDGTAPPNAIYLGDLGSGPPPTFYAYDGVVDSWDYSLWKACYDGLGP